MNTYAKATVGYVFIVSSSNGYGYCNIVGPGIWRLKMYSVFSAIKDDRDKDTRYSIKRGIIIVETVYLVIYDSSISVVLI